ncbi:hypothetical protein [Bacillus toyonensis]|uniref:hypothetical protein n=1 Tax=Bacillus toyonensis TaxID=155322 RepID=UPI002E1A3F08|nr:hypothetical protein [Bacillus toyonensis]
MTNLIIVFVVILILVFFNKKIGRINTVIPNDTIDDDAIELPSEKAYYDETNKTIIELKKEIDKKGIQDDDIVRINALKQSIANGFKEWEGIQTTLEQMIEERTEFVNQSTFYPKDYVFDINRMRTEQEKARDMQLTNPLKPTKKAYEFIKEQNEKVEAYKEIKLKVEQLLPRLDIYEKKLKSKKKQVSYFKMKQQLFIYLQNGELKNAKRITRELNGRVKNIK